MDPLAFGDGNDLTQPSIPVRLRIRRIEVYIPDKDLRLHQERAKLVHGLVDSLHLEVVDWGKTDDAEAHEIIEIIIALGTAGAFTALASVINSWLAENTKKKVIMNASATLPDGTVLTFGSITPEAFHDAVQAAHAHHPL